MMAERGVIVSHEAGRYWGRKFGQAYANQLRRRRPRPGRQVAHGRGVADHQWGPR